MLYLVQSSESNKSQCESCLSAQAHCTDRVSYAWPGLTLQPTPWLPSPTRYDPIPVLSPPLFHLRLHRFLQHCTPSRIISHVPFDNNSSQYNAIQYNTAAVAGFKKMRLLDLSNCKIDSWHQILTLRDLPDLAELILDSNPLPSVLQCPADEKEGCVSFPSLQRLSLSCTKLSAWSDIDHLATYRTCAFMRLSQVPLFMGKGASEVRPLIIGRMPSLVFFNGSAISPRERTDAEKSYLRSIIFAIDDAQASGMHCFSSLLLCALLWSYLTSLDLASLNQHGWTCTCYELSTARYWCSALLRRMCSLIYTIWNDMIWYDMIW